MLLRSARGCGAKRMSESKCTKKLRSRALLQVEMLEKCTPLWREAHFEVKMVKAPHARTTFGCSAVEKVYAVVVPSTFRTQNGMFAPLLHVQPDTTQQRR